MRALDFYWKTNKDWYHIEENGELVRFVVNEDAPPDAQESYKHYLSQIKENGVDFSLKEAEIIVPFLKNNAHLVSLEHKRELLDKIKPNVNEITFGKIQQLLKNLHF